MRFPWTWARLTLPLPLRTPTRPDGVGIVDLFRLARQWEREALEEDMNTMAGSVAAAYLRGCAEELRSLATQKGRR